MHKTTSLLIGVILLLPACRKNLQNGTSKQLTAPSVASAVDLSQYTFLGQDDFSGSALNTAIWDYRRLNAKTSYLGGRFYDTFTTSNVILNNTGSLYLMDNKVRDNLFSGGMISTETTPYHFKYGYFEIRARLPAFYGAAPAFWMQSYGTLDTTDNPHRGVELDIFEYGKQAGNDSLFHTVIWGGYGAHQKRIWAHVNIPGISVGFHTFALEWTPRRYTIYVDGLVTATTDSAISHVPEFLILGNGVGGYGGDPLAGGNTFPDYFTVDYIKVYTRNPEVILYENFDAYGWQSSGLQPGSYTRAQLTAVGVVDNATSSIEVPNGWRAVLYDGDNFTGDSTILNADVDSLSRISFNDKLTSLRVYNHP